MRMFQVRNKSTGSVCLKTALFAAEFTILRCGILRCQFLSCCCECPHAKHSIQSALHLLSHCRGVGSALRLLSHCRRVGRRGVGRQKGNAASVPGRKDEHKTKCSVMPCHACSGSVVACVSVYLCVCVCVCMRGSGCGGQWFVAVRTQQQYVAAAAAAAAASSS